MSAEVKKTWTTPPYVLLDLFFDPGGDMVLQYLVDFQWTTWHYISQDRNFQTITVKIKNPTNEL
jgi:hypothetical protein